MQTIINMTLVNVFMLKTISYLKTTTIDLKNIKLKFIISYNFV